MLKRITLLLLTLTLVFGGLVTAHALDQEEVYTALQEELLRYLNGEEGAMPLDTLATQFNNLGRYKKSPLFGYYTSLLRDAEAGDTSRLELYTRLLRLDADFCAMLPEQGFPTVDEVEAYALGREAQAAGDWPAAIAYYEESIAVLDSVTRVMELLTAEPVLVAEGVVCGDYAIDTYSDRTCVIARYIGQAEQLDIPKVIEEYQVTAIGKRAFDHCLSLISVSIPNSVTSIGDRAFYHCASLTSISIPDSVTSIGDDAFYYCRHLTNISIPKSVTSIGDDAFFHCESLTNIFIPDSVTSIGYGAFSGCRRLTTITIPDSLTSIGEAAFMASSLNSIIISNTHPTYEVIDGALFDKLNKKLIHYPDTYQDDSYTIPEGIQIIGVGAIANSRSLTSIYIPDSVTFIGDSVFANCDALTSFTIPDSVTCLGDRVFASCDALTSITLPDSITSIGDEAFCNCPNLILCVPANSYAHQYAIDNNIPYTTY